MSVSPSSNVISIRLRDWNYSVTAFAVREDQLETLREPVVRDYRFTVRLSADEQAALEVLVA